MIILRNLEKFYEGGYGRSYVLRRVNVEIKEGEFVTIMGPSGAGKSTLLSILGMLDGAWTGEFEFLGHMVHRMKPKDRVELNKKYIGFVFQSYYLIDNLTVYENLDIPLSYRNVKGSERASMVCDTLDRFHIVGKRDLYPSQLSGGQQQLVAVARAVIAHPKLILADEPTGNLHSSQGKEIMELFKKLNDEGTTIVQVTHSVDNAAYGNRVIQLADGWVVSGGSDTGPCASSSVPASASEPSSDACMETRLRPNRGHWLHLQALYEKYEKEGFVLIGVPANEFGAQEPGSNDDIKTFCTSNYGVDFDMFGKVVVKGEGIHPLFDYLTKQSKFSGDIKWNFNKFLVDKNGEVVARFEPNVEPGSPEVRTAIEQNL